MSEQLLGQWLFDESSGITATDSSGNGHDATLQADSTFVEGKVGKCVSLDGTGDYVNIPAHPSYNTSSFSFSLWINPSEARVQGIASKMGATAWRIFQNTANSPTTIEFDATGSIANLTATGVVISAWTHIAVTYDSVSQVATMYRNGVLTETATGVATMYNETNGAIQLGSNETNRFNGLLDEVKYYSRALTDSEVRLEYSSGVGNFQIRFVDGTSIRNITYFLLDFKLEQVTEKLLDKLEIQISRQIDRQEWFEDFYPHNEIIIWYKDDKVWGGRVKDREKKESYAVTLFSFAEILSRRHSNNVYEGISPETIASAIISEYTDMTPVTISSGITIDRYAAFDYVDSTVIKMAEILDWQLKSDADKNLYLQPRGHVINSARIIYRNSTSSNAIFGHWQRDSRNIANYLQLKGDDLTYNTTETFTGTGADAAIGYAYLDDGGAFTDYTAEANNATANDVPLLPAAEATNDAFYFGLNRYFNYVKLNIGTAGVGTAITWEYWNGSWSTLTVTDGTTGFTTSGTNSVTFDAPSDWVKTTVNGANAFWVRARCTTASFTTQPLATQLWMDGSQFFLIERPVQVKVTVDSVEQSREAYEVVPELKKISFVTAPVAGKSIIIDYSYIYPIYLERRDVISIATYGEFRKSLWIKWAKTTRDVREYAIDYLGLYSQPFFANEIIVPVTWITDVHIGERIRVIDVIDNIDQYLVIQKLKVEYLKGRVILNVGNYIPNLTLWHQQVMDRIKELNKSQVLTEILQLSPPAESETMDIAETLTEASLSYINLNLATNEAHFNEGRGDVNDSRFSLSKFV